MYVYKIYFLLCACQYITFLVNQLQVNLTFPFLFVLDQMATLAKQKMFHTRLLLVPT